MVLLYFLSFKLVFIFLLKIFALKKFKKINLHFPMDYRNKIYPKYVSSLTKPLYGEETLQKIRCQFPIWKNYYFDALPKDRNASIFRNASIIDIACGSGEIVYWLHELGYVNAHGIDISEEQIALGRSLGIKNIEVNDLKQFLANKID